MNRSNGFVFDNQTTFRFSNKFIAQYVKHKPDEFVVCAYEDKLNRYLYDILSTLYSTEKDGEYKICDRHTINRQFEEYLVKEFLPYIGLSRPVQSVKYVEEAVDMIIYELLEFYSNHTYEYRDVGRIMKEDGSMFLVVNKYTELREEPETEEELQLQVIVLDDVF